MRSPAAFVFAVTIVAFATLGHLVTKHANATHVPTSYVGKGVCENRPFGHGWVKQVIVYNDDPATLHVQCGDGHWTTADR